MIFSFLLTIKLKEMNKTIDMSEFRFLLTGGIQVGVPPTPPVPWLAEKNYGELIRLCDMPVF